MINRNAYYRLNGDTNDASGNGYNLTNIATCTFPAAKWGEGVLTNGSTQYLRIDNNLGIDGGACTFIAWTKPTNAPASGAQRMITKQLNVTSKVGFALIYQYNVYIAQLGPTFARVRNDISSTGASQIFTMPTDSFTCLIGTYDTTNLCLYVNGAPSALVATSGNGSGTDYLSNMFSINANYYVQTSVPGVNLLYPGLTDEVMVYNVAWTAAEVRNYYNQAMGRYAPKIRF